MFDTMSPDQLQFLVTREMPFGKYKGRILADLPGNYLNWFAREGFPPDEIGRLLALMHEIDHNGLKHLLQPLRGGKEPVAAPDQAPTHADMALGAMELVSNSLTVSLQTGSPATPQTS